MSAPPRIPIYDPATNTVAHAEPGDCPVCFGGLARVASVHVPVDETVACPACTRFGARWLVEEIAHQWRTPGGAA
jgi:hypothetical protein